MNLIETLKLAFSTIWGHRLRSFLTLLGMIIGVTAFMVILSLVQGFSAYIDEKIAKIGSNSFSVVQFGIEDHKKDAVISALRRNKELNLEELSFIKEKSILVGKIGAKVSGFGADIRHESKVVESVTVSGAEPVIADIDNPDIAEGRYFTDVENNNAARVAYIGADIASNLYPTGAALDQEIKIRGFSYRIVGIQAAQGEVFGQSMDSFVPLPLKTLGADFGGLKSYSVSFEGTARTDEQFNDAVEEARTLMRVKRQIQFGDKDNFGIITPDAIAGIKNSLMGPTFAVVLAVPGIALVVGAIVIMNIMLVSVTERTKEIGIRKALGAKNSHILRQFLFESVLLSAIGGIIGLALAELLSSVVAVYVFQTRIPLWSALLAIGMSALVGIASGMFPAWKAAKLDPIEALRTE